MSTDDNIWLGERTKQLMYKELKFEMPHIAINRTLKSADKVPVIETLEALLINSQGKCG